MKLIRKISFGRQVSAPGFASEHPFRPPNKSTRSRITCANLALAPPPPPPLGYCSAVFHTIIKHTKPDINREHPRVGVRSRAGGGVGGGAGTVLERAVLVVVLAAASAAAPAARHRREPGSHDGGAGLFFGAGPKRLAGGGVAGGRGASTLPPNKLERCGRALGWAARPPPSAAPAAPAACSKSRAALLAASAASTSNCIWFIAKQKHSDGLLEHEYADNC